MPVNTSGFSKSQPSGDSSIRDGDDLLRSDKSIIENALNDEHYFTPQTSASSASGGLHRQGSARVFMTARSSVATPASADSVGKLAVCTDTGALLVFNSSSISTIAGGSQPFGAILTGGATQVYTTGNESMVSFSASSQYDVGGFAGASVNTFTIPTGLDGLYQISAYVQTSSFATVTQATLRIRRDGTEIVRQVSGGTTAGAANPGMTITVLDSPSAGSKYDVTFTQNSGVNATAAALRFSIHKVI